MINNCQGQKAHEGSKIEQRTGMQLKKEKKMPEGKGLNE